MPKHLDCSKRKWKNDLQLFEISCHFIRIFRSWLFFNIKTGLVLTMFLSVWESKSIIEFWKYDFIVSLLESHIRTPFNLIAEEFSDNSWSLYWLLNMSVPISFKNNNKNPSLKIVIGATYENLANKKTNRKCLIQQYEVFEVCVRRKYIYIFFYITIKFKCIWKSYMLYILLMKINVST